MKQLFLLFSHRLSPAQEQNAKESLGVVQFVALSKELQELWSNVPADLEELVAYLQPLRDFLIENMNEDDVALVQGDFGATCTMVSFVKSLAGVAVYATTKRDVVEREVEGKSVKTSVFEHVRFRKF